MPRAAIAIAPGVDHFPGFLDRAAQEALRDEIAAVLREAPLFRPRMPRTGKPFSVEMSNCGPLGWVSDEAGYRYQPVHPETGRPWPAMPAAAPRGLRDHRARRARRPRRASSISMARAPGWACTRIATRRISPPRSFRCRSAIPRCSGSAGLSATRRPAPSASPPATRCRLRAEGRLAFHGVDRIFAGSSTLFLRAAGSI